MENRTITPTIIKKSILIKVKITMIFQKKGTTKINFKNIKIFSKK